MYNPSRLQRKQNKGWLQKKPKLLAGGVAKDVKRRTSFCRDWKFTRNRNKKTQKEGTSSGALKM